MYFPGSNTQLQRFFIHMDFRLKCVSRSLSPSGCCVGGRGEQFFVFLLSCRRLAGTFLLSRGRTGWPTGGRWKVESSNGDFPFSNEETKLFWILFKQLSTNILKPTHPKRLRFVFPITYDTNISYRGARPVIRYDYEFVQHLRRRWVFRILQHHS